MKILISILSILNFGSAILAQGLNVNIIEGFNTGNASMIDPFLASEVELIDLSNEGIYSRDQTRNKLQEFFDNAVIDSFKILHEGSSKGESAYAIGELKSNLAVFRIYILYSKNDPQRISEIRIEKDE